MGAYCKKMNLLVLSTVIGTNQRSSRQVQPEQRLRPFLPSSCVSLGLNSSSLAFILELFLASHGLPAASASRKMLSFMCFSCPLSLCLWSK